MLDDVDAENGPLQVIPGSHKGPLLSHMSPSSHGSGTSGTTFCGAVDVSDLGFQQRTCYILVR